MYGTDTEPWSFLAWRRKRFTKTPCGAATFGGQVNPLFFGAFPHA